MLKEDRLPEVKDAIIISCVGSRGQRVTYCNRICCMVGIKNASFTFYFFVYFFTLPARLTCCPSTNRA